MDGQTDGIAVASTGLAMRALRRPVKTNWHVPQNNTNTISLPEMEKKYNNERESVPCPK